MEKSVVCQWFLNENTQVFTCNSEKPLPSSLHFLSRQQIPHILLLYPNQKQIQTALVALYVLYMNRMTERQTNQMSLALSKNLTSNNTRVNVYRLQTTFATCGEFSENILITIRDILNKK